VSAFDASHVDVEHFLDTLGIENITRATSDELRFSCPFPNHGGGDETPSCYMNANTSAFFCHGCKERGTAVEFAAYVLQISPLESIRLLKQAYMPGYINPDLRNMESEVRKILAEHEEKIEQPILPEMLFDQFLVDWDAAHAAWKNGEGFEATDYFFERGFSPRTLNDWGFGYDKISGRVVFPIRDLAAKLIGFKGRAHWKDATPKYLVLGDGPGGGRYGFPRYYPSQVVFGAHRVGRLGRNPLVVCEGELNAIAVTAKMPVYNAVAINGSFFSEWHAKIIRRIAPESGIILFLDDDSAGSNAVWGWENSKGEWRPGAVELLSPHIPVQLVPEHVKDAADMTSAEVEATLAQAESWLMSRLRA
jgi:DNA primase